MWLARAISSLVFLFLIVFTIPLAFDVGGKECGLAFSLSLAAYYFFFSVLRLATPEGSRIRYGMVQIIRYTQWVTILALMIWCLNKFSVDSNAIPGGWVARTFSRKRAHDTSVKLWLFGRGGLVEWAAINGWDKGLRWLTPVFQILEGFCSLLVIQFCGQITRWLVNRERGDSWMVCWSFILNLSTRLTVLDCIARLLICCCVLLDIFSLANHQVPRTQHG